MGRRGGTWPVDVQWVSNGRLRKVHPWCDVTQTALVHETMQGKGGAQLITVDIALLHAGRPEG